MAAIPQFLIDYANSLNPTSSVIQEPGVDLFAEIVGPVASTTPTTLKDYKVILYMKDYIDANYASLPLSSVSYVNGMKMRYLFAESAITGGLNPYLDFSTGAPKVPTSLLNIPLTMNNNSAIYNASVVVVVNAITSNALAGSDPLPAIELDYRNSL